MALVCCTVAHSATPSSQTGWEWGRHQSTFKYLLHFVLFMQNVVLYFRFSFGPSYLVSFSILIHDTRVHFMSVCTSASPVCNTQNICRQHPYPELFRHVSCVLHPILGPGYSVATTRSRVVLLCYQYCNPTETSPFAFNTHAGPCSGPPPGAVKRRQKHQRAYQVGPQNHCQRAACP